MPSKIMYGRRKGDDRSMAVSAPVVPVPVRDFSDVTVLSKEDWERINFQLHRKEIEQKHIEKLRADKEDMKSKSRNLVQHWNNTIAGQRQMKLEARRLREQKVEEERKALDLEEAKFQSDKRRDVIEKAKTQLYYQTDRVRGFHTALRLTEANAEREAQIELKRLKAEAMKGHENEWVNLDKDQYEEFVNKEQKKAERLIARNRDNAAFVNAQKSAKDKQQEVEKVAEFREGLELRRLAEIHRQEQLKLEDIFKAEQMQLKEDNDKQMADQKRMREVIQQQREEEDEECRIFAAAKRKMIRLRFAKEQEIQNEKLQRLNGISKKLSAQMKAKVDNEDDQIIKAIAEKDEARRIEEEAKANKMAKGIAAQEEHRLLRFAEHEEERKKAIADSLAERKRNRELDEIFRQNEEEKQSKRLDNDEKLAAFRFEQQDGRTNKERAEKDLELALDRKNYEIMATEERQFQEYANGVIEHCRKGGRNVVPLIKAARAGAGGGQGPVFPGKGGIRPSYIVSDQSLVQLPLYQRDETEGMKQLTNGKTESKKRLGMVW